MATYPAEAPTETGLAASMRTPVDGDKVPGGVTLFVKNTNAAELTLTITTPKTHGDLTVSDRVVTVPLTTGERFFKVPNNDLYVGTDGLVTLATWSVTTGVTYAVLRAS